LDALGKTSASSGSHRLGILVHGIANEAIRGLCARAEQNTGWPLLLCAVASAHVCPKMSLNSSKRLLAHNLLLG
jgi:hypothetical protein